MLSVGGWGVYRPFVSSIFIYPAYLGEIGTSSKNVHPTVAYDL